MNAPITNNGSHNLSYKLEIILSAEWPKIYEKMGLVFNDRVKDPKTEIGSLCQHEYYIFIEYYDANTGMVQRFLRDGYSTNGNWDMHFAPVDEFEIKGFVVAQDNKDFQKAQTEDEIARCNRLSVEVGDHFVRRGVFDENKEERAKDYKYAEEDYLFYFPIDEVFPFLYELGSKFDNVERKAIVKWPDQIEKRFQELGFTYETYGDNSKIMDIEGRDKEFFEKWGKPQVSVYDEDHGIVGSLSADSVTYTIKLHVFKPGMNERFSVSSKILL